MARILIADDDPIIAELASSLLFADGHACGWVSDGEQALDSIRWRRPDMLLLDQNMPEKCGSVLLRELRGSPDHYDLPIIMLTACVGREDELQARYHGAQEYIRKPFVAENLIMTVREVLAARAHRPKHVTLDTYARQASGNGTFEAEPRRSLA